MQVKAHARFVRMSPRKVRLVIDVIRGLDTTEALVKLAFINKVATKPVRKLLESAIANATNNFKLDKSNLFIKAITADEGPALKRWTPRAFGRATEIKKKSSHIHIILEEKVPTTKKEVKAGKKEDKKKELEIVSAKPKGESVVAGVPEEEQITEKEEKEKSGETPEIFDKAMKGKHRHQAKNQQKSKGFMKKIFNRKSG